MKKIFVFLFSLFLLFSISFEANASKIKNPKIIEKNMEVFKKKLEKTEKGEKILEIVNRKLQEKNKEELEKISDKVFNYLKTYRGENFDLLKYIQYRSDFILAKGNFGEKVEKNDLVEDNFKIYKDEEFGFEILQENDFNIISIGNGVGFGREKDNEIAFVILLADYYSVANIRKISDYIDFLIKTDISKSGKNIKKEKLNINGLELYKVSYEGKNYITGGNYNENYIFGNEEKGILYNISFFDENYKYKEKIINSFKMNKNIDRDFIVKKQKELEEYNLKSSSDNLRKADLSLISKKLELSYLKNDFLPNFLYELEKIPKDRKEGQTIDGCKFGYNYEKISDNSFRLSSCMESKDGKNKAKNDGGIYDDKFEIFYEIK